MPDKNPGSMTNSPGIKTLPSPKPSLMSYATPTANVSAFYRSVLSILIPNDFWGEGDTQTNNKDLFMKAVDRFITLRRFETVSLHDTVQGMKVCDFAHAVDLPQIWMFDKTGLNSCRSTISLGLVCRTMAVPECRNQTRGSVLTSSMSLFTMYSTHYSSRL